MTTPDTGARARAPWLLDAAATLAALHQRGVHAMLLHGPAGTGKWDLAIRFAKGLLCREVNADGDPCGVCADCRWFCAGHHPDLRVLVPDAWADRRPGGDDTPAPPDAGGDPGASSTKGKPSRELKIDAVRGLAGLLQVSAHRPDGFRVIVMAPLEQLNDAAGNALLKNLEEPPGQTRFVLVTDRLDRCLPTVVSRCSLVRVPVPDAAQSTPWLIAQGVPRAQAAKALVHAGGAPFKALQLAREPSAGSDEAALVGLLKLGIQVQAAQIVVQVPRQIDLVHAVAVMQRWCWDWMAVCTGVAPRYFPDEAPALRAIGTPANWSGAQRWAAVLRGLAMTAEHPLNAKLAVEQVLFEYRRALTP